jgi:hypothetical protein
LSIVAWNCDDDGDGAIVMNGPTWTEVGGEYELRMNGSQYWAPGHILGDFDTDTELDPTVSIIQDLDNDTTFAWTDYHIEIGMNKSFSILSTGLWMPAGWTAVITAPLGGQPLPNGSGLGWVGIIDYYIGTGAPVNIGDTATFGFKVSFIGDVQYCTKQYPTPEPTTILLLGLGAMSVIRRRR